MPVSQTHIPTTPKPAEPYRLADLIPDRWPSDDENVVEGEIIGESPPPKSARRERMEAAIRALGGEAFTRYRAEQQANLEGLKSQFAALVRLPARQRKSELWELLTSSPDAFLIGIRYVFALRGYRVVTADKPSVGGIVLKLEKSKEHAIAYCHPAHTVITSDLLDPCTAAMQKFGIARGMVVIRSWFSPAILAKAKRLKVELVDAGKLRKWIR